ncbi:substrate-binding domain-containing protein [Alsobacter sp. SYSU M60028]|uniref:Substrate-binding domain-containing protein n=1 Tax=Alsobacter ponti TaxID=2962936 RepID=A0ABT1L9F9_9HYPH|nr:substrate-binding domain-containing protein [Alsobacter ponti]MCP8938127.1 substrate-binding domain-containing protein [Alsobacter ponti]
MRSVIRLAALAAGISLASVAAHAQSGTLNKAVGGYSFEDAAKESPATKDFNSKDGKLTFAIVTHTAGNGFFDPTYVGAQVAAKAFGVNLIMLGSEAPVDDIPREIAILNQIVQDPTIDGVIMTTPQSGAYDDLVKKLTERGIPVATTNSYDGKLLNRNAISHTGQDASAAAIGGEALAACLIKNNVKGGTIIFPNTTTLGNVEVNNRIKAAFEATVKSLNAAGKLKDFKVDAGPQNIGIDVDKDSIVNSVVNLIESRKDVVGAFAANGFVTPALGDAISQLKKNGQICAFGFDLGPKQQEQIRTGALTGSLGQQPFLQGFWPVAQLYLQIDRGVSAANLDTRAQLVTKESVDKVGKRFEN